LKQGLNQLKKSIEKYHFALCVENKDCEDLEKRKIYQILPDDKAEKDILESSTNPAKIIFIRNPISFCPITPRSAGSTASSKITKRFIITRPLVTKYENIFRRTPNVIFLLNPPAPLGHQRTMKLIFANVERLLHPYFSIDIYPE